MQQYSTEKEKITIKRNKKKVVKPVATANTENGVPPIADENDSDYEDGTEKVTEEIWRESETTFPMFAAV